MCGWFLQLRAQLRQGPTRAGGQPRRPRGAQARPGRPLHTPGLGAGSRKCSAEEKTPPPTPPHRLPRLPTPSPAPHPPSQPPDADPHNSASLRLWLQGRGKCEQKNKRYFFDLTKGAGPRHLKGLSGHHTSCIQGHFTTPPTQTHTPTPFSPDARYQKNLKSSLGPAPSSTDCMEATKTETV